MTTVLQETGKRQVTVPVAGGEVSLEVPEAVSDPTLYREIGVQDVLRRRLLEFVGRLEHIIEHNRELFFCSEAKLETITRDFLAVCTDLQHFIADFLKYHSAIPELEEAREDVKAFFHGHILSEIEKIEAVRAVFEEAQGRRITAQTVYRVRRVLGKGTGLVRTELQKIFAHLFVADPRNVYRTSSVRSEQEILYLQFRREVEVTSELYAAVRRLDTYMRGAIIPSDLIKLTARRIEIEASVACLFEPDYSLFFDALLEEISEQLLPELYAILDLDGIWYDDYENIRVKAKMLTDVCITFKALYQERYGLREEVHARITLPGPMSQDQLDYVRSVMQVFNSYRHREVAESIRSIDQILVDLEGSLLHWEKGLARRAFAKAEWSTAEPFQRRTKTSD